MKNIFIGLFSIISLLFISNYSIAQGDFCSTAVSVSITGTYVADGPSSGGGCFNCTGNAVHGDWYSFTAPGNGTVDISTCEGGTDTRMWVYSGSCGTLNQVAASDDICSMVVGGGGNLWAAEVTGVPVTAGTTYYIEFDNQWSTAGFTWSIQYYPPPPVDIAIISIDSLTSTCELTNSETIYITMVNYGTIPVSSVDLYYEVNGVAIPSIENYAGTILPGDTISYAFADLADLSTDGNYIIEAISIVTNDGVSLNDSYTININKIATITSFPFFENFDAAVAHPTELGQLFQSGIDGYDWTLQSFGTPSIGTGPSDDMTGGGQYIYFETSGPLPLGSQTIVESPCLDISSLAIPFLEFNYHMLGNQMGSLEVEIFDGTNWNSEWFTSGNQGDQWNKGLIDLRNYGPVIMFRFTATGSGDWTSDVALDNILVHDKPAGIDIGIPPIVASTVCQNSFDSVRINIINCGTDTLFSWDMGYQMDGNTPTTETATGVLPPGQLIEYTFTTTPDTSAGIHSMEIWATTGADIDTSNDTTSFEFTTIRNPKPSMSDTTICMGEFITVDARDAGAFNAYGWIIPPSTAPIGTFTLTTDTAATYIVYVIQNDCPGTDTVNISVQNLPEPFLGNDTSICVAQSLTFQGSSSYSYNWSNGSTNTSETLNSATPLDTIVQVTMTDNMQCSNTDDVFVSVIGVLDVNLGVDTAFCEGDTVNVNSGIIGASYQWSTGETTQSIDVNTTGEYIVTVTKCGIDIDTINYNIYNIPSPSLGADLLVCYDDTVSITPGTFDSYNWEFDLTKREVLSDTATLCDFSIDMFDAFSDGWNGAYITVLEDGHPIAQLGDGPEGSGYNAGASMNSIFSVSPNSTLDFIWDENGLYPTECSFDILDDAGTNLFSHNNGISGIPGNDAVLFSTSATCFSPYLSVRPDRLEGEIVVLVANSFGCQNSDTINVIRSIPVTSLTETTGICQGDTAILDGGNNSAYLWDNGSTDQTIEASSSKAFYVTITDSIGCVIIDSTLLIVNAPPSLDLGQDTNMCENSSFLLNTNPSMAQYSWNTGETGYFIHVSNAGQYSVTITDYYNCSNIDTINIGTVSVSVTATSTNTTCGHADGTGTASASGGASPYFYSWSDGNFGDLVFGKIAGTYGVTATDIYGCAASTSITIINSDGPVHSTTVSEPICSYSSDGSIISTVTGGTSPYSFNWNTGATTASLSGLPSNVYLVTITDSTGCTTYSSTNLLAPPSISIEGNTVAETYTGASNGTAYISASGGTGVLSYEWSSGQLVDSIYNLSPDDYIVTVTDQNGCVSSLTITLAATTVTCNLGITLTPVDISCYGQSDGIITTVLTGQTGSASYEWSSGNMGSGISNLPAGAYSVTVTDVIFCSIVDSIVVTQPLPLTVSLGADTSSCVNKKLLLDAGSGFNTYNWSNGSNSQIALFEDWVPGLITITVVVTDADGCAASDTVVVDNLPVTALNLGEDTTICYSDQLVLDAGNEFIAFNWSTSDSSQTVALNYSSLEVDSIFLTAENVHGCLSNDTIFVSWVSCIDGIDSKDIDGQDISIFPNPNDGSFNLIISDTQPREAELMVYTMSGQLVYYNQINTVQGEVIKPINLKDINVGVYVVMLNSESGPIVRRLVIK